jgi:hypothetical protein
MISICDTCLSRSTLPDSFVCKRYYDPLAKCPVGVIDSSTLKFSYYSGYYLSGIMTKTYRNRIIELARAWQNDRST